MLAILDSYAGRLPINILKEPRRANWAANVNVALSAAQGDFICILHQDDMWMEGKLRTIKELIKQYPAANMFLSPTWFIDTHDKRLGLWRCPLPAAPAIIDADTMTERLLVQNFIAVPAPVFRRDVTLSCGGMDSRLWYTPDWDLWLKIAALGNIVYYPKAMSNFRIDSSSMTVMQSKDTEDFRKECQAVLGRHLAIWKKTGYTKKSVSRVAQFSVDMNVFLAALLHRKKTNPIKLIYHFILLMPFGWYRYLRDSRLVERVICRIKIRLSLTTS